MTLEKARELLVVQTSLGGGYNRNAARLILAEIEREHGQSAVDRLICECHLEALFGLAARHVHAIAAHPPAAPQVDNSF